MAYACTSIFATWGAALAPAKEAPLLCALKAATHDQRHRVRPGLMPLHLARCSRSVEDRLATAVGAVPDLAAHQAREAARMVREEGKSLRKVAHHYHVGHSTIVRALERAESCGVLMRYLPPGVVVSTLCAWWRALPVSHTHVVYCRRGARDA